MQVKEHTTLMTYPKAAKIHRVHIGGTLHSQTSCAV